MNFGAGAMAGAAGARVVVVGGLATVVVGVGGSATEITGSHSDRAIQTAIEKMCWLITP